MEGVDTVVQVDDRTLDWTASVAGRTKTWQARITDQTPPERIAWKSIDGAQNDGAVTFAASSPDRPRSGWSWMPTPTASSRRSATGWACSITASAATSTRFKEFIEGAACPPDRGPARSTATTRAPGVDVDPSLPTTDSTTHADESRRGGEG